MFHTWQVQKSAKHYTEAAQDEVTLLTQIRDGDPRDAKHCVRLLDSFEHSGPNGRHMCMVFEVRVFTAAARRFPALGHPDKEGRCVGAV